MKNKIVFAFALVMGFIHIASAQERYSKDPKSARFVTEDVDRFWEAYDQMDKKGVQAFEEYIEKGSPGLKGFIKYRIINADSLYRKVLERKEDYLKSKDVLKDLDSKTKQIKTIYAALKEKYSDAVFPPIYFVVGRFNSGGTVSEDGIILGTEMQENLDGLPGLVAHELIHYQQKYESNTLLSQSLREGSADFMGELISGQQINSIPFQYGENHLDTLAKEFVLVMNQEDNVDWLYSTSGKDDRPNDLGYWMGYKIVNAYFNKQEDKQQAIKDILKITDEHRFLKESGFLDTYIQEVAKMTEKEKENYVRKYSKEVYEVTFKVIVPDKNDTVYITGNQDPLGNWDPKQVAMKKIADTVREITLKLHSPAQFKFTRGSWETEAIVEDTDAMSNLRIFPEKADHFGYVITNWKDKSK